MVGVLRFKRFAVEIYREELIHHHTSYIQLFVDAPNRIHNQAADLQKKIEPSDAENDGDHAGFFLCRAPFGVHG